MSAKLAQDFDVDKLLSEISIKDKIKLLTGRVRVGPYGRYSC
jgi:hypothetical protein